MAEEERKELPGVQVEPEAKKTVAKTLKKFQKVIDKLKEDGWITTDDEVFYHPLCLTSQDVRERLNKLDLLITNKCRISILDTQAKKTQIQIA